MLRPPCSAKAPNRLRLMGPAAEERSTVTESMGMTLPGLIGGAERWLRPRSHKTMYRYMLECGRPWRKNSRSHPLRKNFEGTATPKILTASQGGCIDTKTTIREIHHLVM